MSHDLTIDQSPDLPNFCFWNRGGSREAVQRLGHDSILCWKLRGEASECRYALMNIVLFNPISGCK